MLYTTKKFRDENPVTYKAIVGAVKEAIDYISRDKRGAGLLRLDRRQGRNDRRNHDDAERPEEVITMVPQNTLEYAQFMHEIGSLKNRAT